MRVAVLGQYPLDPRQLAGGVEAAIAYAHAELAVLPDLELHYLACHPSVAEPRHLTVHDTPITFLPRGRLGRVTWHAAEVAALRRELRALAPDLVHAHGTGLYAGAALASGFPAVITAHGIVAEEARLLTDRRAQLRAALDSAYERQVVRRARHLIVISPYVEQVFGRLFRGQTYLVENPCDSRFFEVQREPVRGRILFAGSVIQRKGLLPLVRAFQRVHQQMPEAELHVAGSLTVEADYARACQDAARALLPAQGRAVRFLGALSREQMADAYATCALAVLPSFQETAPVAIEEAMAAGVPVVATRVGGIPWMIADGITGRIVPAPLVAGGDPEGLADVLLQVLHDPGAAELGQRARRTALERFRADNVARRTRQVYDQVLSAAEAACA
ncbi:MAG: glycosyltransferase family 4 protein [Chloroflexi bacterium]|nr:glycosyltransferase family 4 protein [Chloroflexota bacterium]